MITELTEVSRRLLRENNCLPFSLYSSFREQHIANVPVIKPTLICILEGAKALGQHGSFSCTAGSFVFMTDNSGVAMRNIPDGSGYLSLIIEFEAEDFSCLPPEPVAAENMFSGDMTPLLVRTLTQFVEWSALAPEDMWPQRRQEILRLLHHMGHTQVASPARTQGIRQQVHSLINERLSDDITADDIASQLAMSESTLRRKLTAEGTSLQLIRDRARLGRGLHLIQSTFEPIGRIAEQCGYQSQSRFTERFRQQFGVTPSELRKTRMSDSGE